jgi:hypothetical protein
MGMNKSRRIRLAGHEACMEEIKKTYNTFVGTSEYERLFESHESSCEYNVDPGE